jgi:Carboxypeptidase regulatory-like domain/TonB dependent receptor
MSMRLCLIGTLLLVLPATLSAQQGTTELRGTIQDSQGGVLPGVTIVVRNQETGIFRESVSNADGSYFVSGLIPGIYEITAELQGFKKFTQKDVRLEIGRTATVPVTLDVGTLTEVVTVTGTSSTLDLTSKEVGGTVSARELTGLPSVNRNFVGAIGILPGVIPSISTESFGSDSISVNGQDPRNNNYMLDGANNNDDVIGQRAGTQARTAIESVQEFQVITNQFDAEFGRTTGAVINAVTKQGSNTWRGVAFGYFQDAAMTERDYFAELNDLEKPDTSQQQFGGTLGGPVVRDRAHFFASVERVRIDEGITINVPARTEFNTTTTEQTRVWNTVIRFDNQINANNTWGVRWLREESPQLNQIIGNVTLEAAREEFDVDQTVVGTFNSVLGSTRFNTLRVAWTQEDVAFANPCFNTNGRIQANCQPTLDFQTFTTQQSSVAQARVNDAYQIEDTLSWFIPGRRGDHDVKLGFQWQYSQSVSDNQGNLNATFDFSQSNGPFDPNNFRTYPDRLSIRVPGASRTFNKSRSFGAFGQDKWSVNDRLTLTLGLRYDVENVTLPETDNPLFEDPTAWPVDTNNVAPRLGFTYTVGADQALLRGGYGRFYDKTHFELVSGVITNTPFTTSFTRNFPLNNIDPGPIQGEQPTDPFLANGPVLTDETRGAIAAMFPPGATVLNSGATFDQPDRVIPYTDQVSLGVERQLRSDLSVSADYVHAFARDQLMAVALNPTLRATTSVTSPNVRQGSDTLREINAALLQQYPTSFRPFTGAVTSYANVGETDYDALMVSLEKRYSNSWMARVSYTLSHSRGNTSGGGIPASQFQVLDDLNLDLNHGPTNFDQRHNLVVSGMATVPRTGGLTLGWVARALSGQPFTIFNSTIDDDRNGIVTDPLPAGSYSGSGQNAITVDHDGGRNGAYGPGFFKLDLRLGYTVGLMAEQRVELFAEVFNVTNRANFADPTGDQASANFLRLTGLSTSTNARLLQLGARFQF